MTERERRNYEIEPPDSLPRGWLADKLLHRVVQPKIESTEERLAIAKHSMATIKTDVRIDEVAHLLSRGWPEPLDR